MTPDELLSITGAIMGRFQAYYGISLTQHQAVMVNRLEAEEMVVLNDNYPSEWEAYEWRLDGLAKILRAEQLEQFREHSEKQLRQLEQSKIEEDKAQIHQIRYHQEILDFLLKEFHPAFFENSLLLSSLKNPEYRAKVEFLKGEYRRFLDLAHRRAVINHFRYHRSFQPNLLEVNRIRNKIRHIEPDYGYFYHQMDAPTKTVADFLVDKLDYLASHEAAFYNDLQKKLHQFYVNLNQKYFSIPPNTSYSKYQPPVERPLKLWTPTILLIDENKYGLEAKW